ncbi:flavin reductase family protein [Aliibacillus thermotolerans]|uniref:Flavin reductase family protein n=1 Tax=Aliibacillus thermotolerans TaxID=1834418 RepID=A0ABW0UAA5_9BACI|nr:flavin reductase family protein [Aliibacillus thermotolerans]MDA3129638.1 flavin reductase [Aliibacillus thermotolerans]
MDDRTFRQAMGQFATGVTIVTTEYEKNVHGMTANAFMSVSLNPKLIAVSVDHRAKMLRKMIEAQTFAVNILTERQKELSMLFAGQIKLEKTPTFARLHGVPIIEDSLVSVVCRLFSKKVAGDHTIFIGEVIDIKTRKGEPLLFYSGNYYRLSSSMEVSP